MRNINWGILGTGNIARTFAKALKQTNDSQLIAIGSRELTSANLFKEEFQVERAYGSYEDLVKDPDLDVIYIATPHRFHKENAILCVQHHKAVLCEKPFTVNSKEANAVYRFAKEKNVFIMEAMWMKFNPTIKKVMEWINEGEIGDVRLVQANFCYDLDFDPKHRIYNPNLAGGGLLDVGIYPITLATMIYGLNPESIQSSVYIGKSQVDEQAVYVMNYGNGKQAILTSAISVQSKPDAIIYGTKGFIEIPKFFAAESAILVQGSQVKEIRMPFEVNGYEYEIDEVNQCLNQGKFESSKVPMQDTIRILEIMDQIRKQWNFTYPFEM